MIHIEQTPFPPVPSFIQSASLPIANVNSHVQLIVKTSDASWASKALSSQPWPPFIQASEHRQFLELSRHGRSDLTRIILALDWNDPQEYRHSQASIFIRLISPTVTHFGVAINQWCRSEDAAFEEAFGAMVEWLSNDVDVLSGSSPRVVLILTVVLRGAIKEWGDRGL